MHVPSVPFQAHCQYARTLNLHWDSPQSAMGKCLSPDAGAPNPGRRGKGNSRREKKGAGRKSQTGRVETPRLMTETAVEAIGPNARGGRTGLLRPGILRSRPAHRAFTRLLHLHDNLGRCLDLPRRDLHARQAAQRGVDDTHLGKGLRPSGRGLAIEHRIPSDPISRGKCHSI